MPAVCAQAHIFAPNITSSAAFPQEKVAPLSDQIAVPPFLTLNSSYFSMTSACTGHLVF